MTRAIPCALLFACLFVAGCEEQPPDPIGIDATGVVRGEAYVDANGNGMRDDDDTPLRDLRVRLLIRGTPDSVAAFITGGDGRYNIGDVPVGLYDVVVDELTLPDTLDISSIDNTPLRVQAQDTAIVNISASFPTMSVADAKLAPIGRRLFIDGIALNDRNAFQDGSVYVTDGTATVRLVNVGGGQLLAGNQGRFAGSVGRRDAQPVLTDVDFFITDSIPTPDPRDVTTAVAANAQGGNLDAALVRVTQATIISTQAVGSDYRFTLDDGSGAVEAAVRVDGGFEVGLLVPGTEVNVSGVLVPASGIARWILRPRRPDDVSLGFPTVTVAEARTLPAGTQVIISGTALNNKDAFGDNSVHIQDGTGSIRGVSLRAGTVLSGDRARFVGTIASQAGQPVLSDVAFFVLSVGELPAPTPLTTVTAHTAGNGVFDAAHVQVRQAQIQDTTTVGTVFVMGVNDGTGRVDVVLQRSDLDYPFEEFIPGKFLTARGVLIPRGDGTWRLFTRNENDVQVNPTLP